MILVLIIKNNNVSCCLPMQHDQFINVHRIMAIRSFTLNDPTKSDSQTGMVQITLDCIKVNYIQNLQVIHEHLDILISILPYCARRMVICINIYLQLKAPRYIINSSIKIIQTSDHWKDKIWHHEKKKPNRYSNGE